MADMTPSELTRSVFSTLPSTSEHDPNKTCPSCNNDKTDRVIDPVRLALFKNFWDGKQFRVQECHACGAVFHFEYIAPAKIVHNQFDSIEAIFAKQIESGGRLYYGATVERNGRCSVEILITTRDKLIDLRGYTLRDMTGSIPYFSNVIRIDD